MKMVMYRGVTGFALPTILVVSIVMLTVLVASVATAGTIRTSLDDQRYTLLASEAAESGSAYALSCFRSQESSTLWTDAKPLRTNTDCSGTAIPGASNYVTSSGNIQTRFEVRGQLTSQANGSVQVKTTGYAELLRTSSSSVRRTYQSVSTQTLSYEEFSFTSDAAGFHHTCFLISAQTWCYGENSYGQLGDGTTNNSTRPVHVVQEAGLLANKPVSMLTGGDYFECALATGEVYCWGRNNRGQLGNGTVIDSAKPVKVGGVLAGKNVSFIASGTYHACAIASGKVYCWGYNFAGQIGDGTTVSVSSPVLISAGIGAKTVVSIEADNQTCAVTSDGQLYCWGLNDNGQIGNNTLVNQLTPLRVDTFGAIVGSNVTEVAAMRFSTCATADGAVYCWGDNLYGQLGDGAAPTDSMVSVAVAQETGRLSGKLVTQSSAGDDTMCVIASSYGYCWGRNQFGQLGDGSLVDRTKPVPIAGALTGVQIDVLTLGDWSSCAVPVYGYSAYCWGNNQFGQLGDGSTIDRPLPTLSSYLRGQRAPINF